MIFFFFVVVRFRCFISWSFVLNRSNTVTYEYELVSWACNLWQCMNLVVTKTWWINQFLQGSKVNNFSPVFDKKIIILRLQNKLLDVPPTAGESLSVWTANTGDKRHAFQKWLQEDTDKWVLQIHVWLTVMRGSRKFFQRGSNFDNVFF